MSSGLLQADRQNMVTVVARDTKLMHGTQGVTCLTLTRIKLRTRCFEVVGKHRPKRSSLTVRAGLADKLSSLLLPVAAPAATAMALQFTPVQSGLGGVVLGICAVAKYALTGRILGISGVVKGLVLGDIHRWRFAFLGGLLAGAYIAAGITPNAFELLPPTYTMTRAVIGGLLVGLGAALGNGCTSGHGLVGNARLSIRSFVYTLTFMAASIATAKMTNTAAAVGLSPAPAALAWPSSEVLNQGGLLVATSLLTLLGLVRVAQQVVEKKPGELLSEAAVGAWFAFGLVYSGMVRPSKVIGFLTPFLPSWDPSLLLVMGCGIAIALPGLHSIIRDKSITKPYYTDKFDAPKSNTVDAKLILGGILFGVGWGMSGLCPGPALVGLVRPSSQLIAYVAAMLGGLWLGALFDKKPEARLSRPDNA
eukprot:jgi/Chrzof1/7859/Cz02g39040.t1